MGPERPDVIGAFISGLVSQFGEALGSFERFVDGLNEGYSRIGRQGEELLNVKRAYMEQGGTNRELYLMTKAAQGTAAEVPLMRFSSTLKELGVTADPGEVARLVAVATAHRDSLAAGGSTAKALDILARAFRVGDPQALRELDVPTDLVQQTGKKVGPEDVLRVALADPATARRTASGVPLEAPFARWETTEDNLLDVLGAGIVRVFGQPRGVQPPYNVSSLVPVRVPPARVKEQREGASPEDRDAYARFMPALEYAEQHRLLPVESTLALQAGYRTTASDALVGRLRPGEFASRLDELTESIPGAKDALQRWADDKWRFAPSVVDLSSSREMPGIRALNRGQVAEWGFGEDLPWQMAELKASMRAKRGLSWGIDGPVGAPGAPRAEPGAGGAGGTAEEVAASIAQGLEGANPAKAFTDGFEKQLQAEQKRWEAMGKAAIQWFAAGAEGGVTPQTGRAIARKLFPYFEPLIDAKLDPNRNQPPRNG